MSPVTHSYPIRFADQLRQHIRALRKKRGLTQAQLGSLLGVSQARIAEIEANPGLVNFEQILQLLSALGVTLSLDEDPSVSSAAGPIPGVKTGDKNKPAISRAQSPSQFVPDYSFNLPPGKWDTYVLRAAPDSDPTGVLVAPARSDVVAGPSSTPDGAQEKIKDEHSSDSTAARLKELRMLNPHQDVQPTSQRNFIIRPKKGSW